MKLHPENNYCILDPDTIATYTAKSSYDQCLPDDKGLRKHLIKNGVRGQSTAEGQWIEQEIKDVSDIKYQQRMKDRKTVLWCFAFIAAAIVIGELIN